MPVDEHERRSRQQKFVWYALTLMAVIAIIVLNSDRSIVGLDQLEAADTTGFKPLGRMSPTEPKPIEWIAVLGERNSGTRWLYE